MATSAPNGFATTEWSLVLASTEGGPALDRLCRTYWQPVYVYVCATGLEREDAQDATQEFFADMLRRDWLKIVDRDRGSFRAFLRSSVRLFLNNRRRHLLAQKRGGGEIPWQLQSEEGDHAFDHSLTEATDPAELYEQAWANCVLEIALSRLGAEQANAGRSGPYERLREYVTSAPAPGDYERIAQELGTSTGQVAVLVHRLSRRFAELIRAEVAATLADPREVETELRYLLRLVSGRL